MPIAAEQIVILFATDPIAILHRRNIADILNCPNGLYVQHDFKYVSGLIPVDDLFNQFLKSWVSSNQTNATAQYLVQLLRVNPLFTSLSEKIEAQTAGGDANTAIIYEENISTSPTNSRIQFVTLENNKFVVLANELIFKLDSVRSKKIILLSVNGPARKGKSLRINQFLKYFSWRRDNSSIVTGWLDQPLRRYFPFGRGDAKVTSGIYVWDEIIQITHDGEDIAVLLLDCQGLYDPNTRKDLDTKLFAFCFLLSSVFIYLNNRVSSDVLDSLNMFATISESIQPQKGSSKMLQKLIYVFRDYQGTDYNFGYYDKDRVPLNSLPNQNFQHYLLQQNSGLCASLNKITDNFSTYLMPTPRSPPNPTASSWDSAFKDSVVGLVENAVGSDTMSSCYKKLGDEFMTGEGLKRYIELLITLFRDDSKFPAPGQLAELNGKWHASILGESLLRIYKKRMEQFLTNHEEGVQESELITCDEEAVQDCLREFGKKLKPMYRELFDKELNSFQLKKTELLIRYKEDNDNRLIQTAAINELFNDAEQSSQVQQQHEKTAGTYMEEAQVHSAAAALGEQQLQDFKNKAITNAEKQVADAKTSLARCIEDRDRVINNKDKFVTPSNIHFNSRTNSTSVTGTELRSEQYNLTLSMAEASVEQAQNILKSAELALSNLKGLAEKKLNT